MSSLAGRIRDAWETFVHRALQFVPTEAASNAGSFIVRKNVAWFRQEIAAGARRNLAIHHPHLTPAEIEATKDRFLDNVGRMMGEFSVMTRMRTENRIELRGFDPILEIYGKKPILAVALHTGNWEVVGSAIQIVDIKMATFYEKLESLVQRRIAIETRERLGFRLLDPSPRGLRDAIALLRSNGVVSIFGDEARAGKCMAPLFGRPPHDKGNLAIAARLARKVEGCQVVVSYVERLPRCHFRLHVTEPFTLPTEPGRSLLDDVGFLNGKIEPIILANLDNWYYLDDAIDPIE